MHPCIFCVIRKDKLKVEFMCNPSSLRTVDAYNDQVSFVSRDPALQSVYGIKRDSTLNSIPHYHVTSGLPSDVMHDLLEGVACDVIKSILQYCASCGFVTLQSLNEKILMFPYVGTDKCNKPDVLTEVTKYRQTAAKCRCFLELLPLMLGQYIPVGDETWEVLLLLLNIHNIVFAPELTEADTFLLDEAVEIFLGFERYRYWVIGYWAIFACIG